MGCHFRGFKCRACASAWRKCFELRSQRCEQFLFDRKHPAILRAKAAACRSPARHAYMPRTQKTAITAITGMMCACTMIQRRTARTASSAGKAPVASKA